MSEIVDSRGAMQKNGSIRTQRLLDFVRRYVGLNNKGVEIGPYDRPLLGRPEWNVLYADVYTTKELKNLAEMNPLRNSENVPMVDLVLAEQSLTDAIRGREVDFVFASHVYEHMANFLGFLRDISEVLGPGGRIIGAFPDRRYTFDIDRPRTTIGQLLDRDRRNLSKPCAASVFDHFFYFRSIKAGVVWNNGKDHGAPRQHTLERALIEMEKTETNYVDAHCNIFTDLEFREMVADLAQIGLPLKIEGFSQTARPFNEFFFCLEVTS